MMCEVVVGSAYPAIEPPLDAQALAALPADHPHRRLGSLLGRASVPKHDSHFAVVELDSTVPPYAHCAAEPHCNSTRSSLHGAAVFASFNGIASNADTCAGGSAIRA